MRLNFNYRVVDVPFFTPSLSLDKSVEFILLDKDNSVIQKQLLGYVSTETWINLIQQKKRVDFENCFIENFDINLFRKKVNLEDSLLLELTKFSVSNSIFFSTNQVNLSKLLVLDTPTKIKETLIISPEFYLINNYFDCQSITIENCNIVCTTVYFNRNEFKNTDFVLKNTLFNNGNKYFTQNIFSGKLVHLKNLDFGTGDLDFSESHFKCSNIQFEIIHIKEGRKDFNRCVIESGDFNFDKSEVGHGDFVFRNVIHNQGNFSMSRIDFGNGNKDFSNTIFSSEKKIFTGSNFNSGKVSFKNVLFNGNLIDFHFSTFDRCELIFDRAEFGSCVFDLRAIEFNSGTINFYRNFFADGDQIFEAAKLGTTNIMFKNCRFGKGTLNFSNLESGNAGISFENVDFGQGMISFRRSQLKSLNFSDCELDTYTDLRLISCFNLDLSDTIIKDIVDINPTEYTLKVQNFNLAGIRLLGKIYIDWNALNLKKLIKDQKNDDFIKAEQFRLLKENFNAIGNYDQEDLAYVEFKRHYAKATLNKKISSKSKLFKPIFYTSYFTEKLIFDRMGHYATNPLRVLLSMVYVYLFFSILYLIIDLNTDSHIYSSLFNPSDPRYLSIVSRSFYHSIITFFTIGYGDYYPDGILRVLSGIEGFIGMFMMSYFTVAFARKVLR